MTWDGVCEHGLLLDTWCEECDKPMSAETEKMREAIARALVGGEQNWQEHEIENRELVYQSVDEFLATIEAAGWALRDCKWTYDYNGSWITQCGNAFCFNDGGPEENDTKFCAHCGGKLVVVPKSGGKQ
jgi:uncharacterized phage-like protein YoqJ